jgi:hypothetical protein
VSDPRGMTMKKASLKGRRPPSGEKRQFLISMDPAVVRAIKVAALEDDMTASAIMEEAAKAWLMQRAEAPRKP